MLLKYFYDKSLAHASYLLGCQRSGVAMVIDPGRNVDIYFEAAAAEGMQIVATAETHIHADYVSGSRELAARAGAKMYLSDEGPKDWKYQVENAIPCQMVKDGDVIYVGNIKLDVIHTPGHTPEHISFLLTDEGSGANIPMGIFTGDFVFVGSTGRPDLLETAVGVAGSAEAEARTLYRSLCRFRQLPDHLQVWPAHGAGSACGKGLGAVPSSTVGYEKLFNPALQFDNQQKFVDYILADQPETPFYFAVMKQVNKDGCRLIRDLPAISNLAAKDLPTVIQQGLTIEVAAAAEFASAHVPGTINIPLGMLVQWAGFFVDYDRPLYLVANPSELTEILRRLRSIGIDNVQGAFDAAEVTAVGLRTESYLSLGPKELQQKIESGTVKLIDVRSAKEIEEGHIPGAEPRFLGKLIRQLSEIDNSKPIVTQCLSGGRSAIAASILQRAGFSVTNMAGGYRAWVSAGLPVTQ